jgi:prepilin peptidase dependent protein B
MNSKERQAGVTLMELLISISISMVVVASMVALMGNSLGSASRIIQMTQLSDELRNTMSMMTRDLRRANYTANAVFCYGNSDCGTDGSASQAGDITVVGDSCLLFNLDRDLDGDASEDGAGGFRRATRGTIGFMEMWVGDASPDCAAASDVTGDDWITLTDPEFVDISSFNLDSTLDSFTTDYIGEGGTTLRQATRVVMVGITGELVLEDTIRRRIEDRIRIRNDFLFDPGI